MKDLISAVADHFYRTRAVGHTQLALNGLKNSEKGYLVVHSIAFARALMNENPELQGKVIAITDLSQISGKDVPILVDNFLMTQLIENYLNENSKHASFRKGLQRAILILETAFLELKRLIE